MKNTSHVDEKSITTHLNSLVKNHSLFFFKITIFWDNSYNIANKNFYNNETVNQLFICDHIKTLRYLFVSLVKNVRLGYLY